MGVISGSCSKEQAKDKEREREETESDKRGKRKKGSEGRSENWQQCQSTKQSAAQ